MTHYCQKGSALIMTLFVALVLFILGTGIIFASNIELKIANYDKNHKIVSYMAEAGLEEALYRLKNEPGFWKNPYNFESDEDFYKGNTYSVTITKNYNNTYHIKSIGQNQKAKREISANVKVYPDFPKIFNYAAVVFQETGDELLKFATKKNPTRKITITGDIHSNGKVILDDKVTIKGNVSLKSLSDLEINGAMIEGETLEDEIDFGHVNIESISGSDVIRFEGKKDFNGLDYGTDKVIIVRDYYEEDEGEEDQGKGSDKKKGKGKGKKGKTRVEPGDINISGEINGRYVVIAEGDITINGEITYGDPDEDLLLLISQKDIVINFGKGSKNRKIDSYLLAENEISFSNLKKLKELVINGGMAAGKKIDSEHKGGGNADLKINYDSRIKCFKLVKEKLYFTYDTDTVRNIEVIEIDFK